jgi:hypothetical protein
MMEHAPELISALQTVASFLEEMGIPGLVGLILIGPSMMVIAVFALDYLRQRHARALEEAHRQEVRQTLDFLREIVEQHRADNDRMLRDFGEKHAEVTQYYKDNVELARSTQRMATDMRDIIVINTRALEHLASAMQANFYCPAAREAATGKK